MAGKRSAAQASNRQALLEIAAIHFQLYGYESMTLRQLARDAGMTTGGIFSNFTGKADLFEAAMGRPAPDMKAFLEKAAGCLYYAPPMLEELAKEAAQMRADLFGEPG